MRNININLVDGTYDGDIFMYSGSKVTAVRLKRDHVSANSIVLSGAGVYLLLVGNNSVYVGESDSVAGRIVNTHSGTIDSSWHTVVAFVFADKTIGTDELLYLENAMCEYVYNHYANCLTTTPTRINCNEKFRNGHYHLSIGQIYTCKQYLADIEHYIQCFPHSIFPADKSILGAAGAPAVPSEVIYKCKGKVAAASAVLTEDRKICVLKGSRISDGVSPSLSAGMKKIRNNLIADGTIQNGVFTKDWEAPSVSTAANVVLGTPTNGRGAWKTDSGTVIGDVLK